MTSLKRAVSVASRTVRYTSGSTGAPKGTIMSDTSFRREVDEFVIHHDTYDHTSVGMVDSPMAVSSTPYNLLAYLLNGGRCAVYENLSRVFDVAFVVSPSSMGLVPQLWSVLHKDFTTRLAAGEDETKLRAEFRERLGFRVRGLNCGGATPVPAVQKWLKETFTQCHITENYAATETGNMTSSYGEESGVIKEGVEVKLVDFAEYKSTDKPYPRGEICVKTNIMADGYLNRPDLTADAWDKDGFYHTGDIGEMIDAQHVKVIDRKKSVFKRVPLLANGEWVSPENVEGVYQSGAPSVAQIFLHGGSNQTHCVAVVVPVTASTTEAVLLKEIADAGKAKNLRHFEIPRVIVVSTERFTVDNGLLTQTNKLCRWQLRNKFAHELAELVQRDADMDAEAADKESEVIVRCLRAALDGGVSPADGAAWDGLQWDSIRFIYTANLVKARLGVAVPVDAVIAAQGDLLKTAAAVAAAAEGKVVAGMAVDWEAELRLADHVPVWTVLEGSEDDGGQTDVLVTGATGFLGSEAAVAAARQWPESRVVCLVRADDDTAAMTRLRETLVTHKLWEGEVEQWAASGRVVAMAGHLDRPSLGLSPAAFTALGRRVAHILHVGAAVNHMAGYATLRTANVLGAVELLNLAATPSRKRTKITYTSTISVVTGEGKEGDAGSVATAAVIGG